VGVEVQFDFFDVESFALESFHFKFFFIALLYMLSVAVFS